MPRSYKIIVEYNRFNETSLRRANTLYITATSPDLAVLLHTLDESGVVASLTVFSTISHPALHTIGKLTGDELGIPGLKKLK